MSKYAVLRIGALTAVSLMFITTVVSHAEPMPKNPFSIEQFKVSTENKAIYGDYRNRWFRMTGFELSSLHWNQFVAVFVNQGNDVYRHNYLEFLRTSQDDYDADDEDSGGPGKFKKYPVGTIVAKEGFNSHGGKPGEPTFLVLMKKHPPGYDDANGNWEYMQFTTDGQTLLQGKGSEPNVNKVCFGCHVNVSDRDFIFSSYYSGPGRK